MAYIKSQEEIEEIKKGGKILGEILDKLAVMAKPGVNTWKIDQTAERLIREAGGRPAFKGYKGRESDPSFPSTICASLNEDLVHGIASKEKVLKEGDIFSIDIGMEFPAGNSKKQEIRNKQRGFFTDTAITVAVGEISEKTKKLLKVTKAALEIGIAQCKVGGTVANIGQAIEEFVKSQGNYGIVRDLVGHGVGHAVHEDPRVPNFYDKAQEKYILEPGVVIAIEPMISMGDYHIVTADDGWSISMADKSLCAHFEHTIIVTEDGPVIATKRPSEK